MYIPPISQLHRLPPEAWYAINHLLSRTDLLSRNIDYIPVPVRKSTPSDKNTGWEISAENTKSGAGL